MIGKITKRIKDIQRLIQILNILSRYGFGYVVSLLPLDREILSKVAKFTKIEIDDSKDIGVRIRRIAEELGPTFIKIGQIISTRPDIIPQNICNELSKLQDNVAPFDSDIVKNIILKEFDKNPEELFEEFDYIPFGAASLCQVHRAKILSGEEVAVKIQRPGIEKMISTDLSILLQLAEWTHSYIEESRIYDLPSIVIELKKQIIKEVDFKYELRNIQRFRNNFKDSEDVCFPETFQDYSSKHVLTLEKIKGIKVNELEKLASSEIDLKVVAEKGYHAILKQVFEDGFFHADPHPGNIFIQKDGKIAFIDFGLVGTLDPETISQLAKMLSFIIQKNLNGIINILESMGMIDDTFNSIDFRYDLLEIINQFYGLPLKELPIEKLLIDFIATVRKYKIKIHPSFVLLIKTLITIQGVGHKLDPNLNIVEEAQPFVINLIKRQYSPKVLLKEFIAIVSEIATFTKKFPIEARQAIVQLRKGKMKIEFEHIGLDNILHTFNKISSRIVTAIILASIIVGSSLIILSGIPPKWHNIPLLGVFGFICAGMLGAYLFFSIMRND